MFFPIGDLHGRCDLGMALYAKIKELADGGIDPAWGATIVWLGDYIDRGPQSKELLDFLMNLEDTENVKNIFLLGNHEEFMLHCYENPYDRETLYMWVQNGGEETLNNFNIHTRDEMDTVLRPYVDWLNGLPYIYQNNEYVFVHAGVNPAKPLDKQLRDTCLWQNRRPIGFYKTAGMRKIVVHGHTFYKGEKWPTIAIDKMQIAMDVGANFTNKACTVGLPEFWDDPDYEVLEYWVQA